MNVPVHHVEIVVHVQIWWTVIPATVPMDIMAFNVKMVILFKTVDMV